MKTRNNSGGLDYFKIAAALLVVSIHTSPLSTYSMDADFILTRILARIAVPFFLMVTGCFILPDYLFHHSRKRQALLHFIKKTALLYALAAVLYLPVGIYAGIYKDITFVSILKMIIFDGTLYHLWYLPASILGILIVYLLSRRLSFPSVMAVSLLLYFVGLFGDSYYGLISGILEVSALYDTGFHLFSYTRNGLFYAPIFLITGAWLGHSDRPIKRQVSLAGFVLSLLIMTAEGLILRHFHIPRHDSMYLALLPGMLFLYQLLLSVQIRPVKALRSIALWIYIIHPLAILAVRVAARATGLTSVFVENSLVHYLAVCGLSAGFAVLVTLFPIKNDKKDFLQGRAWVELDRNALRHNVKVFRTMLPDTCELMPAVKAEAYGHGAVLISRELNAMGVKAFCVASVLEGVKLRKNKIKGEILVLGYTSPEQFYLLRRYHLIQTVIDHSYAEVLQHYGKEIRVHIGIDTGMHRLGERCENINEIYDIFCMKTLKVEGIFTHLCANDTTAPTDKAFTQLQAETFYHVIKELEVRGCACPKLHLQASYGVLNYPELAGDYARIGIALYGVLSTGADQSSCQISLKPVLSIKARVASVRALYRGEAAGYGLMFTAKQDMTIAALAIGYADGLPRSLSNGVGKVLINGCEAPIIGRICMDQTLVDVTGIPDAAAGSIAVIIGKSGDLEITACDIAAQADTITNEILSRLGMRLERQMIG